MVTLLVCVAVTSAATEPQFLYYFISIISRSAQGYRDRYDIIEHGHEKSTFVCFFQRPIFTKIREFAAIVLWMLAVFNCQGRLS